MCFNISINKNKNIIENSMNIKFNNNSNFIAQKHISAFSNPLIPVITSNEPNTINLYYWGLIPYWTKNIDSANRLRRMTYNAKCETLTGKPSFRYSIKNQKCLIISDGFYEWKTTSNGKECYYISSYEEEIFTFAGIWSTWNDTTSGNLIHSVSMITQNANSLMEKIHNVKKRQPVILHQHNQINWLNSKLDYQNILDESFNIELKCKMIESPLKSK